MIRRAGKWEEAFQMLQADGIGVFGVAEMHLRDEERPPECEGWVWEGCNREGKGRRGGGVGFFSGPGWQRQSPECQEHLWMTGRIAGQKVAVLVVYLWTGTGSREKNSELVRCIERDYHKLGRPTIIMGDFNAHLEESDGRTDYNGKLLLDVIDHLDMIMVNAQNKCTGTTTWTAREMSSTIDYCLMSPDVNQRDIKVHGDR